MKKIIAIALTLFVIMEIKAQNEFPCVNEVSTNPYNPFNNSLPYVSPPLNSNLFLNQFNWYIPGAPLNQYPTDNMLNLNNDPMENAFSSSMGSYYLYVYGDPIKPYVANGWELLSVNLGYFPNGTPLATYGINSSYRDIPYFILYHRYKGIIRVFANMGQGVSFGQDHAWDAAILTLTWEKPAYVSGLFRLNEGNDRTLDRVTTANKIVSLTKHPNGYAKWFSADFQVAYDPCVCQYPSNLRLNFDFVQQQSLELVGRSISVENNFINNKNALPVDYLTNFEYDFDIDEADKGLIMHKHLETMIDDYIAKMEAYKDSLEMINEHNRKVERNLAIVKAMKQVILGVVTGVTGIPMTAFNGTLAGLRDDLEGYANDVIKKNFNGVDTLDLKKLYEEGQKALGEKTYNFISEKFKKLGNPDKPIKPTATYAEMRFRGSLDRNVGYEGPVLFNPGTYGNSEETDTISNVHEYPLYNNALGVFALLERPKLLISKSPDEYECEHNFMGSDSASHYVQGNPGYWVKYPTKDNYHYKQNWTNSLKFKIGDDLKYVINPALDVKSYWIDAQIYLDVEVLDERNQGGTSLPLNTEFSNVNVESMTIDLSQSVTMDTTNPAQTFSSLIWPINGLNNFVGSVGLRNKSLTQPSYNYTFTIPFDINNITPPVIPNRCDSTQPLTLMGNPLEAFSYKINGARLKLFVNIEYETVRTDGESHEYTYTFTYDILPEDIIEVEEDLYPGLASSTDNVGQWEYNLYFEDTVEFNGSAIDGCKLVGTHYTCRARNDVFLNAVLTTANNHTVDIMAGNQIEMLPESEVFPEITLSIAPVFDYSNPMPPASSQFVNDFCSGSHMNPDSTGYKGRFNKNFDYSTLAVSEEEDPKESIVQTVFDFVLFPNPTTGNVTVAYSIEEHSKVSVEITDITGRKLLEPHLPALKDAGSYTLQIDTQTLAKGIYLVTVQQNNQTKTKQLVVQ